MNRPQSGPCWKCEKPTKSHVDVLIVYTPLGHNRVHIHTCHPCWDKLEEGELTEYKIKLRNDIEAKAALAIQNEKVEAARKQHDEPGAEFPSVLGGK